MQHISEFWANCSSWLTEHAVIPLLAALHLGELSGDPHEIAEAWMIALAQIGVIGLIFRPLESLTPAEAWSDRRLTSVDRRYTFLMVLGLNPLFAYLVLLPLSHWFGFGSESAGSSSESLFSVTHWLPSLKRHPLMLFGLYYVAYDFTYYWMHRVQHAVPWWWALHSMHHSQRQMSCWTNDRGSYIDGFLQSMVLACVGIVIGVSPEEFALLNLISELAQNFSHTNVRVGFGRFVEKLLVGPKFHRLHHMRVDFDRPTLHNCNYGQVFSVWDIAFGTALYGEPLAPTGVGDPTVDRDNDYGVIAMQWRTAQRFWSTVRRAAGWKIGEVQFDNNYAPIPVIHGADPASSQAIQTGVMQSAVPTISHS